MLVSSFNFIIALAFLRLVVSYSPTDPSPSHNVLMIKSDVLPGVHWPSHFSQSPSPSLSLPLPHFFTSISNSIILVVFGLLGLSILFTILLLFYHTLLGIYQSAKGFAQTKQDQYVLLESRECEKEGTENDLQVEKDLVEDGFEEVQLFAYDSGLPPAYEQISNQYLSRY